MSHPVEQQNPYLTLAPGGEDDAGDGAGDAHWAFGTGFSDPLQGVDTALPAGVDGADLAAYCLMLADDALVMSHRLQEWCTRGPELEVEVATANIALDLLGQARLLYARAGAADGSGRGEDWYAFQRNTDGFRNVTLVEAADADFAGLVARLLAFSCWRLELLDALTSSRDPVLAAVAAKGVPELTYHRDYAAGWVVRLGDGTATSHRRMQHGVDTVWPLLDELFAPDEVERRLADAAVAAAAVSLRSGVDGVLARVLEAATLRRPEATGPPAGPPAAQPCGRCGRHTGELPDLLAELQGVARAHPGATW